VVAILFNDSSDIKCFDHQLENFNAVVRDHEIQNSKQWMGSEGIATIKLQAITVVFQDRFHDFDAIFEMIFDHQLPQQVTTFQHIFYANRCAG
jgi:hypothetical protein